MKLAKIWSYLLLGILGTTMVGTNLACNTFHGVGKDTQKAGEGIQDAADRNK